MHPNNCRNFVKAGSHVLVVGLGKTGLSAVTFFTGLGARVSVSESRSLASLDPESVSRLSDLGVFLETGGHSIRLFTSVDRIMVSPGVPLILPALAAARSRGIEIFGDMALTPYCLRAPLAAITGTNGKSTVTSLLGELLRASGRNPFVGGNIGIPLTDYLLGEQEADSVVLEVSSYQLDTGGDFKPQVAILLNITPDHLDRYDSYEAYAAAKLKIFARQDSDDSVVLNLDDPEIMSRLPERLVSRAYFFGADLAGRPGATLRHGRVVVSGLAWRGGEEEYDLRATDLSEPPNTENAMAAILAARLLGCPPAGISKGLLAFRPLAHRLTPVAEIDGVRFLDDSKATNVGAVYSALRGIERPVVLIAGGREKGSDYRMIHELVRQKVKAMIVIGEARARMVPEFAALTTVSTAASLEEAVTAAASLAAPGDVVLLSPACASFDMFTSYAQRGAVFADAVSKLAARRRPAPGRS